MLSWFGRRVRGQCDSLWILRDNVSHFSKMDSRWEITEVSRSKPVTRAVCQIERSAVWYSSFHVNESFRSSVSSVDPTCLTHTWITKPCDICSTLGSSILDYHFDFITHAYISLRILLKMQKEKETEAYDVHGHLTLIGQWVCRRIRI